MKEIKFKIKENIPYAFTCTGSTPETVFVLHDPSPDSTNVTITFTNYKGIKKTFIYKRKTYIEAIENGYWEVI